MTSSFLSPSSNWWGMTEMSYKISFVEKNLKFAEDQTIGNTLKRQLSRKEVAQKWATELEDSHRQSWGEGLFLEVLTIIHYHPCMTTTEILFPGILEKERAWRNQRLKKPKFNLSSLCSATFFRLTCLLSHLPSLGLAQTDCKHDSR